MKAKFYIFIIALILVNTVWGQRINVNVRITRLYTPYNGDMRWNVWVDGSTNNDDGGDYACFAISGNAGWNTQFVNRTMPYYIFGDQGKIYNFNKKTPLVLNGTLEGYHKNCFYTGGSSNGSYCDFKSTCYGNSGLKNGKNDDGYKTGDFNITINSSTIPGTWITETATNGVYQVEYEYLITPLRPDTVVYSKGLSPSPFIENSLSPNICGGETFYLTASSTIPGGDYVWQENTNGQSDVNGLIWNDIPGENAATLKVVSPSYVSMGDSLVKYYRVFKRNGTTLSLDPADGPTPFYIFPPKPNIENSDNYRTLTHVKCKGQLTGKIKVTKVEGAGDYKYTLFNRNGIFPILNSVTTYPTFPDDAYNKPAGMTGLPAGRYILTVQNNFNHNGGCFDTIQFTITEPKQLVLNTPVKQTYNGSVNISCNGKSDGSLTLTATGGVAPYIFYLDDSSTNPGIASHYGIFNNLSAGSYSLSVHDNNGCVSANIPATLVEPAIFNSSVTSTDVTCKDNNDGIISFTNVNGGAAPYYYSIDNKLNYLSNSEFNSIAPGNYICNAKDANGCTVNDVTISINEPAKLTLTSNSINDLKCYGGGDGSISVIGEGGVGVYKYAINNDLFQTSNHFSNLQAGTHRVKIKDANNCIESLDVTLSQPDKIDIAFDIIQIQCTGFDNGLVNATVAGGIKPYVYDWIGLNSSDTKLENLSPGDYKLKVTDANNCSTIGKATVAEPSNELIVDIKRAAGPKCNVTCNGEIELEVSGGTPPYSYAWNDDLTKDVSLIDNLCKGIYVAKIWDSRNCVAKSTVILQDSVQFNFQIPDSTVICPGKYATLDAGFTGSSFEWTVPNGLVSNNEILSTNVDGTYHLKVTRPDGCFGVKNFNIRTSKESLKAQFLLPSFVALGDTVVFVEVSNPVPDSVYWSFEGSPEILNSDKQSPKLYFDKEGTYKIKLTSYLGECIDSLSKTITFFIPLDDTNSAYIPALGLNRIKSVRLYPNPNSGIFKVEVNLDQKQPMDLEVVNSQGNPVYKGSNVESDKFLENISLGLPTGVYLLKIQTSTDFKTVTFIVN